jgi:hypothetical protein
MMLRSNCGKRMAYMSMGLLAILSVLVFGTSTPVFAHHRDVGDGECSWFPDKAWPVYDFHEACTNHDACGEKAGSNKRAWDDCDRQLRADARQWCERHHSRWSPLRYQCLNIADEVYWGLRAFVNGTRIHRN